MINLNKLRYVYLEMTIQQGEFEHQHRILFATRCSSVEFAVKWYIAHYWGCAERDGGNTVWLNGEMAVKSYKYKTLLMSEYQVMYSVMYMI